MRMGVWAIVVLVAIATPNLVAIATPNVVSTIGARLWSIAATDLAPFTERARDADIVILGEVHDNPLHHANQAAIVAALQPAALVFEMIPQDAEDEINDLRDDGASRVKLAAALDWANSGWPDFAYYAEILEAAPNARIFGAEQPTADVRRAMVEGATGPFGPDAAIYGLDQPLDPEEQAAREALQAAAHCETLPAEVLPSMVEAQRFRDAGLADAALWARTMTGSGQVVVITGNGHADKRRGMPEAIAVADPEVQVLSLGQLEAAPQAPPATAATVDPEPEPADPAETGGTATVAPAAVGAGLVNDAFDEVFLTDAPDRPDPCTALKPPLQ